MRIKASNQYLEIILLLSVLSLGKVSPILISSFLLFRLHPQHVAASRGFEDITFYLIQEGMDINAEGTLMVTHIHNVQLPTHV